MSRVCLALSLLLLAGCPSSPAQNPSQLWLAPNGSELALRLVSAPPTPF